MAQKRNRKTAVVQCAGGCRTGLAVQGGKEAEDDRMQYRDCADRSPETSGRPFPVPMGLPGTGKLCGSMPAERRFYKQQRDSRGGQKQMRGLRPVCEGLSPVI